MKYSQNTFYLLSSWNLWIAFKKSFH